MSSSSEDEDKRENEFDEDDEIREAESESESLADEDGTESRNVLRHDVSKEPERVRMLLSDLLANVNELHSAVLFEDGEFRMVPNKCIQRTLRDLLALLNRRTVLRNGALDRPGETFLLLTEYEFIRRSFLPVWTACKSGQKFSEMQQLLFIFYKLLMPPDNGLVEVWPSGQMKDFINTQRKAKTELSCSIFWSGLEHLYKYLKETEAKEGLTEITSAKKSELVNAIQSLRDQADAQAVPDDHLDPPNISVDPEIHQTNNKRTERTIANRIEQLTEKMAELATLETEQLNIRRQTEACINAVHALILFLLRTEDIVNKTSDKNSKPHFKLVREIFERDFGNCFADDWRNILLRGVWLRSERAMTRLTPFGDTTIGDTQIMWRVLDFYYHVFYSLRPDICGYIMARQAMRSCVEIDPNLSSLYSKSFLEFCLSDSEDEFEILSKKKLSTDGVLFGRNAKFNPNLTRSRQSSMAQYSERSRKDRRGVRKYLAASYVVPEVEEQLGFLDMPLLNSNLLAETNADEFNEKQNMNQREEQGQHSVTNPRAVYRFEKSFGPQVIKTIFEHITDFIHVAFNKLLEGWIADCASQDILISQWDTCKLSNFITWVLKTCRHAVETLSPIIDKFPLYNATEEVKVNAERKLLTFVSSCRVAMEVKCITFVMNQLKREVNIQKASSRKKPILKASLRTVLEHTEWTSSLLKSPPSNVLFLIGKAICETLTQNGVASTVIKLLQLYTPRRFNADVLFHSAQIYHLLLQIIARIGGFVSIRKQNRGNASFRRNAHRTQRTDNGGGESGASEDEMNEPQEVSQSTTGHFKRISGEQIIKDLRDGRILTHLFSILRSCHYNTLKLNDCAVGLLERITGPESHHRVLMFDLKSFDFSVRLLERNNGKAPLPHVISVWKFAKAVIDEFWKLFESNQFLPVELLFGKKSSMTGSLTVMDQTLTQSVHSNYTSGADAELLQRCEVPIAEARRTYQQEQSTRNKAQLWTSQEDKAVFQLYEMSRHLPVFHLLRQLKKNLKKRTTGEIRNRLIKMSLIPDQDGDQNDDVDDDEVKEITINLNSGSNFEKKHLSRTIFQFKTFYEISKLVVQYINGPGNEKNTIGITAETIEDESDKDDAEETSSVQSHEKQIRLNFLSEFLSLSRQKYENWKSVSLEGNDSLEFVELTIDSDHFSDSFWDCQFFVSLQEALGFSVSRYEDCSKIVMPNLDTQAHFNRTFNICWAIAFNIQNVNELDMTTSMDWLKFVIEAYQTNEDLGRPYHEIFRTCLLALMYVARLRDENAQNEAVSSHKIANLIADAFESVLKSRKRSIYSQILSRLQPGTDCNETVFSVMPLSLPVRWEPIKSIHEQLWCLPNAGANSAAFLCSLYPKTLWLAFLLSLMGADPVTKMNESGGIDTEGDMYRVTDKVSVHTLESRVVKLRNFMRLSSERLADLGAFTPGSNSVGANTDFEFVRPVRHKLVVRTAMPLTGEVVSKLLSRILSIRNMFENDMDSVLQTLEKTLCLLYSWCKNKVLCELESPEEANCEIKSFGLVAHFGDHEEENEDSIIREDTACIQTACTALESASLSLNSTDITNFLNNVQPLTTFTYPIGPLADCSEYRKCLHSLMGMPDDPWQPTKWRWEAQNVPVVEYERLIRIAFSSLRAPIQVLSDVVEFAGLDTVSDEDLSLVLDKLKPDAANTKEDEFLGDFEGLFAPEKTAGPTSDVGESDIEYGGAGQVFGGNEFFGRKKNLIRKRIRPDVTECNITTEPPDSVQLVMGDTDGHLVRTDIAQAAGKSEPLPKKKFRKYRSSETAGSVGSNSAPVAENPSTGTENTRELLFSENYHILKEFFSQPASSLPVSDQKDKPSGDGGPGALGDGGFTEWALDECKKFINHDVV